MSSTSRLVNWAARVLVSEEAAPLSVAEIDMKPGIARNSTRGPVHALAAGGSLSNEAAPARRFVPGGPFVQLGLSGGDPSRSADAGAGSVQQTCGTWLAMDPQEAVIGVCCVGAPVHDRTGQLVAAVRQPPIHESYSSAGTGPALSDAAVEISHATGWARDCKRAYRPESDVSRASGGGKESIFFRG
jgi:DNA-binding IclR family transcriptional regulator